MRFGLALLLVFSALFQLACDRSGTARGGKDVVEMARADPQKMPPSFSEFPLAPKPSVSDALLAQGKKVFDDNCAVCHGEKGDGKGPAAPFLVPAPRDLVQANFRLRSTGNGELPTDADLFRSVSLGLPGTPMPPWRHILNDQERWAVVEYVKQLSPRFASNTAPPKIVDLGKPPERGRDVATEGKQLFIKYNCHSCHGETGVGDGPQVPLLVNDVGQSITPRNLTRPRAYKSGYSTRDIVRAILTGFNGTPMLGFAGSMPTDEAWKMAYYIESLQRPTPAVIAQASRDELRLQNVGEPDVKLKLIERAWKYEPNVLRVKRGQVVQITFEPTDNGLGVGHGFAISGYDEVAFLNGAMVGLPKTVKFQADQPGEFTFYCATQCSTEKLHPLMLGTFIVEDTEATRTASAQ